MHAMISLCVVLLLAVAGCSKTDERADRDAAQMDQPAPGSTTGAADQDAGAAGTTTTFEETRPPPNQ